jgi:hypothetical protein
LAQVIAERGAGQKGRQEAFLIVICVDKPAGDTIFAVADHFTRLWFEHIDAVYLDPHLAVLLWKQIDVWFAEDDKEIASAAAASP